MKKLLIIAVVIQASFAMASYTNFLPESSASPWGALDVPANWPGGVFPSGNTTGLVTSITVAS